MTRMLTALLFVLALAGGALAQNPLDGTEPDPVEVGEFLGIDYSSNRTESSVEIKIYDEADDLIDTVTIQLTDGDGAEAWFVNEGTEEFIVLRDPWGNSILILIDEP